MKTVDSNNRSLQGFIELADKQAEELKDNPEPFKPGSLIDIRLSDSTPKQEIRIHPGSEITVKFTVLGPLERVALLFLQDRGYIVYKKNCGRASLD